MDTVGERVKKAAETVGGLNALAKVIGMPRRTLGDQISGKFEVKLTFIVAVAEATGCSIDWLATGLGQMTPRSTKFDDQKNRQLDELLMRSLAQIAIRAHQQAQIVLRNEDIAVEAATLYNELKEKADDINDADEVNDLLPWLEGRLVRRLAKLKAAPAETTTKRA